MIPIIDNIFSGFSCDLGIDLGTANILIGIAGKGVVLREPAIVCRHRRTKKIIAIGSEAKKMIGRTPDSIEIVRPMRDGVISDFDTTAAMLTYFVRKINAGPGKKKLWFRPRMIMGIPMGCGEVQRRAVLDAALAAGARSAILVEEPMAAAMGAGLPVTEPEGLAVVDIGGGTCEIAILSLGGIVCGKSLKIAGDAMDGDITSYVRARFSLTIGERTAQEIKMLIGSAYPPSVEKEMVVRGRDIERGIPKTVKISSVAVREALAPAVNTIVEAIRDVIRDAPPELASDISERGIFLCGGGALLGGFPKIISQEVRMPTILAGDPASCVVLGTLALASDYELLKKVKVT